MLEFEDKLSGGQLVQLTQSAAIITFLEENFPRGGTLFPADPVQKARALEYFEMVNAGTQPLQNLATCKGIDAAAGAGGAAEDGKGIGRKFGGGAIAAGLAALEGLAKSHGSFSGSGGSFLCGPAPTVADAALVPQLFNARRFGVDLEATCPGLLKVEAACSAHPWFVSAHPEQQHDAVPPPAGAAAAAAGEKRAWEADGGAGGGKKVRA